MASIRKKEYKNKTGKISEYFYIIGRDKYGRQIILEVCKSKQEAERNLHKYNGYSGYLDITVEEIFDSYWPKLSKYSVRTQYNYQKLYDKYIQPIENMKYRKLNPIFLQSFFDEIEKYSAYSAANCLKMFKAAVNNAIKKQLIKDNKLDCVDPIKLPEPDKNPLDIEEVSFLLNKAKELLSKRDFVIIYTLVGSGLRQGEVFALNKADIKFGKYPYITVNKQYTKGVLEEKLKASRSKKPAYICEDLANTLRDYMNEFEGDLLFPNSEGGYIDANNFRERVWKPFLKQIGINKRVRLHDLRGTFINMTLSLEICVKYSQNNAGHSTTDTTLNNYAQNNIDMIADASKKLDRVFSSCWKNVGKKSETNENSNVIQFPRRVS